MMVFEPAGMQAVEDVAKVLILVVVDDGLWEVKFEGFALQEWVLILVVVDDGLWEQKVQCGDH